jgi:hypothetical protein
MKKLLYTLFVSTVLSLTISACTEEEVAPKTELNGGGHAIEPLK